MISTRIHTTVTDNKFGYVRTACNCRRLDDPDTVISKSQRQSQPRHK
jgi:hypothetical protein